MSFLTREAIGIGNTIFLAQQNACQELGVQGRQVSFEVIQLPRKKFLGLFGGRPAKVKAMLRLEPSELAANYLSDVLNAFGATGFGVEVNEKDDGSELLVRGGDANHAIGRRGDTLDAIQYLTGLVANSAFKGYYRVTINIEDYRERREKTLEILGRKLAFKVLKSKEKVSLEPMTPYERKVIHTAVQPVRGVESYSEGEGLKRHVVIAPLENKSTTSFKRKSDKFKFSTKNNSFSENKIPLYERCK